MKENLSRIMLCFAALDLDDVELRQLVEELHSTSWREIKAQVSSLRRYAKNRQVHKKIPRSSTKKSSAQSHDASVGERVERLLKDEAGLTTNQAAELLALQLAKFGLVDLQNIPPLSRKPLRDWVGRLAQRVPEKDILRYATIIRNEYVHRPMPDWALRGS
ncbi:MAG TPA: hypothetical protein VJ842_05220 [Pyrinomonadaceae bacterium]|nr:hypothetical protein [Pyrinomonadaceae bacterium]